MDWMSSLEGQKFPTCNWQLLLVNEISESWKHDVCPSACAAKMKSEEYGNTHPRPCQELFYNICKVELKAFVTVS